MVTRRRVEEPGRLVTVSGSAAADDLEDAILGG